MNRAFTPFKNGEKGHKCPSNIIFLSILPMPEDMGYL
jgi:hypothetical protein